jgi:hypothetical protein
MLNCLRWKKNLQRLSVKNKNAKLPQKPRRSTFRLTTYGRLMADQVPIQLRKTLAVSGSLKISQDSVKLMLVDVAVDEAEVAHGTDVAVSY